MLAVSINLPFRFVLRIIDVSDSDHAFTERQRLLNSICHTSALP
jgi:hypothetical protein